MEEGPSGGDDATPCLAYQADTALDLKSWTSTSTTFTANLYVRDGPLKAWQKQD